MKHPELIERPYCPLCGNSKQLTHIEFPDIPVVRCSECNFIYSARMLSDAVLTDYYRATFGSMRHRKGQQVNASVNVHLMQRLLKLSDTARVLDVGTGYGFLLDALRKRQPGLSVTGVELSKQEADYARDTLGLPVLNSLLTYSGLAEKSFDLVCSFEVIEHIPKPVEFIAELYRYVKPGGHLLIMTDNFEGPTAATTGAGFPKWIPHSHISHFSGATLNLAIEKAGGLSVVAKGSYRPWEFLALNLIHRLRGKRIDAADAFDLQATLAEEMGGGYRLFALRRLINSLWARATFSQRLDGDLIYILAKRRDDRGS